MRSKDLPDSKDKLFSLETFDSEGKREGSRSQDKRKADIFKDHRGNPTKTSELIEEGKGSWQ